MTQSPLYAPPSSLSTSRLRSGVDAALLRQMGGASTAIFLLRDYDKFGLTERVGYHFDLSEALSVLVPAREEAESSHDDSGAKPDVVVRRSLSSTSTTSPTMCGVVSLLECAPATPWHRLSRRQKRAVKSQLRSFNATAETARSNISEDIFCYQPTSLPLRLNPSTRLFFAYEVTRIVFCVDASPSMTSTFGAAQGSSTSSPWTSSNGTGNGPCCPLDRLPEMARTFFTSLVEPISAPSLSEGGLWKPVLGVTVLAVFPLGKKAETSLLVRDYRVDSVAAAHVLSDQIRKWLLTDVEVGITERLSRRNSFSTWSIPLYSSSLRDILDACDSALSVLSNDARPVIVVATDGRSISCDGVVNVFLDIDRVDIPVIVLDVSLPGSHATTFTHDHDIAVDATRTVMKSEWNFLTYDPGGPSDFPLHLSDDTEALYSVCRATAGFFFDQKLLEETANSIAGQPSTPETPAPYHFSYKRRFAKMNGVQWLTLFSLSPLSPTFQGNGVGKGAATPFMKGRLSAAPEDALMVDSPDLFNFSRHDAFATRQTNDLRAVPALGSASGTGTASHTRVTFSTYFVSPVRIKALLMIRIKEGYRAKQYGSSTKDLDKVFIQFVLHLDNGTALYYEVSFKSLHGQHHEVGSAHIKIELSGETNFVQAVKNDFLSQNSDSRPSTLAQKVSARLCQVMRWIRREDILQSYLSPPAKWTDQLTSSETPLARRLGGMTRLQRRRHFRCDEFDVICTGQMPYTLEGGAIFSEFVSVDNGEQELLNLIQDWSTQVINREELRFVKARTSKNGTTSYILVETRQSNIAPRLFTISLEFVGVTDPRERLHMLAALKRELGSAKDVDVLGKQMGPFLLGTSDIAHSTNTIRNVEFQYHHAQWELVKDPELLPLVMKRRTEIGRFRLIQSNDMSAIFAKVVPENVVDTPGDLVQYQIAIQPDKVLVDLHMESECGVFFPFSLAASDTKKFNGMVHVLKRRDQECGRALRSRTNLLSVFAPWSKGNQSGSLQEPHTESVKRMLQYSSRVTRKVRFFHSSTGVTNDIYYDLTEELLLSNSFGVSSAKLSINALEKLKDEEEGLWFIVQFDRNTMSIVHLSSVDHIDNPEGGASYTYRNLTLFTSGISDLYSKRDDTNDDDSVDSHISEYMCVTEFLDRFEAAETSNFASAAYLALRHNDSTFDCFHRDDLEIVKNSLEFVEVAKLLVEGHGADDKESKTGGVSKLVRLIQTILAQVPGDDECLFYSGTEMQDEVFRLSDDESGPSVEGGDASLGDSQDLSPDDTGFLDVGALPANDEDAALRNTWSSMTAAPIFVRFKVDGEIVPFASLNKIEKSSTLVAEISIRRSQVKSVSSFGASGFNFPSTHQAVISELNILLKWYVAEQTIERLRQEGTNVSQDDLKVVQKCMKRVQSTIAFSIEVYFYVPKMDIMVPASAPAGGESQVVEGFALLHEEMRHSRTFRFHPVSSGGYYVAEPDQRGLTFWCFIYSHISDGLVSSQIYHPGGEQVAVEVMKRIHDTIRTYIHRVNQQLLLNSLHRNRTASSLLIASPKSKTTPVSKPGEDKEGEIFTPGSFACPIVFRTMFDLFHRCAANPSQVAHTLEATVLHSFAVSNRSGIFVYKDESEEIFYMRLQARGTGIDGDGKVELLVHGINRPGPSVTHQLKVLLQRRLLMIAVEMLSAVLTKNPHFRVSASDLDFLRSFDMEWTSLAREESTPDPADMFYEFPEFVYDPTMVLLMLRQNLCGSTFFHRLNDIGYERLSPAITESRPVENGGTELIWNNHEFTLYYNNAATTLNQSFQGVSTLTERGAELSRQIGNGIAMIEILLIRADGTPMDKVIFAESARPCDDLHGLEKANARCRRLPMFPESGCEGVCVRIRVTDTGLSRRHLHEWTELSLNQAMTSWIIERQIERATRLGSSLRSAVTEHVSECFVDDNQKLRSLERLCPGLPCIRAMLENLYSLPHPAVSQVAHHGVIRSSSVASKTLEMLDRCIFSTLSKDVSSDTFRSARSNLRVVRTSRSSAPELVQLYWDPSKRRASAYRWQEGNFFNHMIHDSPIDCPEYLCYFQLNQFEDNSQQIEQNIRLYKEVVIHDGINDGSATIELLESIKASRQGAFARSFSFVFSVKRNRRTLATYNWTPSMVLSVRNRLQELEKSSLEIVGRSAHALQYRSLKALTPPTKVQEAKGPQHSSRSTSATTTATQTRDSASTGQSPETQPGPRKRIPRPVVIRQPKLIGKSVEGAALQAVAASRKRASTNQFKNASSAASIRRSSLLTPSKEAAQGSGPKLAVTAGDGGSKRGGRPPAGIRRPHEREEEDDETIRIKADFKIVCQKKEWKARRRSVLVKDSTVFLSDLLWPRIRTHSISLSMAEVVISKSPMAFCDAFRPIPFPSGLDSSFVPMFARWISAFSPNVYVLQTAVEEPGTSKANESIILASVMKNVRGTKGFTVVKISKTISKGVASVVRLQGWIVRLPRRTHRDQLKKHNANVISASFREKDATGLDKLASDLHRSLVLESLLFDFSASTIERVVRFVDERIDYEELILILRGLMERYTLEQQKRIPMLNYRVFEANLILKSFKSRMIDKFDSLALLQGLRAEAEERDLIQCGASLCFRRGISVKGSQSVCFLTPDPLDTARMRLIILCRTQGRNLSDYMFREGSNVAIHIVDNIVLECVGLVHEELSYIAEKLYRNAMWKNLSTRSSRPRMTLEYTNEMMELCSVQPILQAMGGNGRGDNERIIDSLLGPQSAIDWKMCCQCMKKELSFGPSRSFTGSHETHLFYIEASGVFFLLELTLSGNLQRADIVEREADVSGKSRQMTVQILMNFFLHFLWQSL